MKTNKLAAGALALALGLGAVAPAVAAETNNSVSSYAQQRLSNLEKELNELAQVIANKEAELAKLNKYVAENKPASQTDALKAATKKLDELKKEEKKYSDAIASFGKEGKTPLADLESAANTARKKL